ncbi:hypothetical protein CDD81_775 [Ophiocordyceps australis]|uniref:Mg2+ transporter protein, CorA-like/Zinc transport protein ZntB n=1 Tax=Ophiocordyceps australis TaxID=1399860 RepID=A0A2C5Y0D1_9HYPO|nr:hypothetical protein CDD81_775 [Ophiocordyceps australis]
MDEYFFGQFMQECRVVDEVTSYLEIFNYSDAKYDSHEEHPLPKDEFDNFLHRRGAFAARKRIDARMLSGLRLIVQKNASDKDTFAPRVISLSKGSYREMMGVFRLPLRAIETTSVVGPFFWSGFDEDDEDPHLHIIHRKSDVRKKGRTRGWELILSHSLRSGLTSGFLKGTPSSDVAKTLAHVGACARQVCHPFLLPILFLSYDLSPANDQKQRDARDWLRRLENAVSLRDEVDDAEQYFPDGYVEVDGLNRDLVECHGHVMWKRPQAYWAQIKEMDKGMERLRVRWRGMGVERGNEVEGLHRCLGARLEFYRVKLKGLENYIYTTLERLKVQREALYNIMSQREARLNLEIAKEQRRIAHASKRDSTAMKSISLMGAIFLPGTYLASVFSMTFFNFQADAVHPVATQFWIYFAVTIPLTAAIVGTWYWFDHRREAQHTRGDQHLEEDIMRMEKDIMLHLRRRTIQRPNTWNTLSSPVHV